MKYLLTAIIMCAALSSAHASEATKPVWLFKVEGCNVYKFRAYGETKPVYLTICDYGRPAITKG